MNNMVNYFCSECNGIVVQGVKGDGMCNNCGLYYEDISNLKSRKCYKFVIIGKIGENLFPKCIGDELRRYGHVVVNISHTDIWKNIPNYEFEDVKDYGKPLTLKWVEYQHSPDFIFIEQTYIRFKNDVKCPVIYHCREYTHYPDLLDPDLLLFEYPNREEVWKFYFKWEYTKLKRANKIDNLWAAFEPEILFTKEDKCIKGISDIGIHIAIWRYRSVNGPMRRVELDSMGKFRKRLIGRDLIEYLKEPIDAVKYRQLLSNCEAIMLDMGVVGAFSRRAFEAAYCKTLMFFRVFNEENKKALELMGLKHNVNCIFFFSEDELAFYKHRLERGEINKQEIINNAYKWSFKHTYAVRCSELLDIIEKYFGDKKE